MVIYSPTMRCLVVVTALAGCDGGGAGSLELTLTLPTQAELRPSGMTTVTITATAPGESPFSTTSEIANNRFAAGDLPVGTDVQVSVVLRDVSNRIVGVGEAGQTVDIVGDQATQIEIPVRRPFVYAASGASLYSFDPTLDPRDDKFQGVVTGVTNPQFTVSVGGDRLAVIGGTQVHVIVTATNTVSGAIQVPGGARDATAVPGTHKLAIAHDSGITIVDLDASSAQTANVGPVDRVTVGVDAAGALVAYGLVGRVAPPETPYAMCTGSSSFVAVAVDSPEVATPVALGTEVSDLAASPDTPQLFATLPCDNQLARVGGAIEGTGIALSKLADLERAAVVTVAGDRVWAAGMKQSSPTCTNPGGTCSPTTSIQCPVTSNTDRLRWVTDGASVIIESVPLTDGAPIRLDVPDQRETIIDTSDAALQHAQVLKALGAVPLDLVVLPGGQYVGLVMKSRYYVEDADPFLPCLDVTTGDWLLVDMASSSVAQRVRTACTGRVSPQVPQWVCEDPPNGQRRATGIDPYMPTSVGALFGAR